jgi:L-fucose isomerase-like protein
MAKFDLKKFKVPEVMKLGKKEAVMIANGDERPAANLSGWPGQVAMEAALTEAFKKEGWKLTRAHQYDPALGHGFIASLAQADEIFNRIPKNAVLVVAESVWEFSYMVVFRLWEHEGPILIASNFDGSAPGLVGALGIESCLTKHKYGPRQKGHSFLWSSEEFKDAESVKHLKEFLKTGRIKYDVSHAKPLAKANTTGYKDSLSYGAALGQFLKKKRARMGVFDPLCMGMLNAALDEEVFVNTGVSVRRLNQSDLYAEMQKIPKERAFGYIKQLEEWGMKVDRGPDFTKHITDDQLIDQGQMYEALVTYAAKEKLDGIGIPWQLGLAKLCAASDLPEAMLNSSRRPPVVVDGQVVAKGEPIMCANEADMGCGIDQIMSKMILQGMNCPPETTQHDVRWGDRYKGKYAGKPVDIDAFIWVFELSGNTPAEHVKGGWGGITAVRQPHMYFAKGGASTKGICKPGEIVWSRVYVNEGVLSMDIGRGGVVELPEAETERRWKATDWAWPIMHAILYGVSRDNLMAKHKSNHITIHYAPDAKTANQAMFAKAAMAREMGMKVYVCGNHEVKDSVEFKLAKGKSIIEK